MAEPIPQKYYIDFIDPLFAVILHISFTHTVMLQPWFSDLRQLSSADAIFRFLTLLLGYMVVVQSWVGYHESVRGKPISRPGRFYVDIFLLTTYLFLLLKFESFAFVLVALVVVFGLFIAWDKLKAREYGEDQRALFRRKVTAFWFVVILLLA